MILKGGLTHKHIKSARDKQKNLRVLSAKILKQLLVYDLRNADLSEETAIEILCFDRGLDFPQGNSIHWAQKLDKLSLQIPWTRRQSSDTWLTNTGRLQSTRPILSSVGFWEGT